jgi:DNA-binding transcriptional LysR family regulator
MSMPLPETDRWGAMAAFVAIGDRLSFADAAEAVGISASALSRRISQLEERLGCRLLNRTTRRVALTEAGTLYLEQCRTVIEQADAADAAASSHTLEPRGVLRVGLPNLYGQLRIAPLLPSFLEEHPQISLQLNFDDHYADLVERRLDVAVRIGTAFSGDFIARKLAPNPRLICASPEYLTRRGAPRGPRELAEHDCLHFSPLLEAGHWRLSRKGQTVEAPIRAIMTADNAEALRQAAVAGLGLAILAHFVVAGDLEAGRLVPVLTDWTAAESDIHIIYPNARYLPLKTRAFIDFLVARMT